jgi:nucleotide-binding universal stress UspA family protein
VVAETLAKVRSVYRGSAETLLAHAAAQLEGCGLSVQTDIVEGRPAEAVLAQTAAAPVDLIVIGAKGLSAPGAFHLGSTAQKLVEYADCSVLIARPVERVQPWRVTLAADGSPQAQQAACFLCALALPQWAEVNVVSVAEATVGQPAGERRLAADVPAAVRQALLDAAEARAAAVMADLRECGAQVRCLVRMGHPAAEILAAAQERDANLIVVGAKGQDGNDRFRLGGVAQKVASHAPCSVLLVR